jgi:2-methylisocitrate lyase-like PEP mutase family enzyme
MTRSPMLTQAEKGRAFRALHERDSAFIIPNPWDIGTARLLAHLGFEALATTSAGYAISGGRRDNTIDGHEMIALRICRGGRELSRYQRHVHGMTCDVIGR